ncbi:8-amino-7-oxononanoate synthase [Desulfovibrio inopinatus]|uniref:8-amino-7-oxononanoate synthase n=1 Tax=Desulfovibrio inopinatus TaxID=102109 RepID=UPI00040B8A6C|nr:8-amino-7-oxononanoate synthase [Desulfovibrio inopinatus]
MMNAPYAAALASLPSSRFRRLQSIGPSKAGRAVQDGREYLDFSSNDYLGLSVHPDIMNRSAQATQLWGTGSRASRLVRGNISLYDELEELVAKSKGTEAALIFASGYQANSSVLPALLDKTTLGAAPLVFSDKLNHASMHAGCKTAGVRQIRYRHLDIDHLHQLLRKHCNTPGPRFILSETVFSMDGDAANIWSLAELADEYNALLYLDDAHASGCMGKNGAGLSAHLDCRNLVVIGTFSKALGGFGAYIAASQTVCDFLVNKCAGLIYSTALPPSVLAASIAALELVPDLQERRDRLARHGETVRRFLRERGIDTARSSTHIIPAIIGDDADALALASKLRDEGLLVVAIRPPTVPEGTARLRISVCSEHSDADIETLLHALDRHIETIRRKDT